MERVQITFAANSILNNYKCRNCGDNVSFYHFDLRYSTPPKNYSIPMLSSVCSEECATMLLLKDGVV